MVEKRGRRSSRIGAARSGSSPSAGPATMKKRSTLAPESVSATRLDQLHDAGRDLTPYMDWSKARRPGREVQRVNVDFPVELLDAIDKEAARIGVTRQAFI